MNPTLNLNCFCTNNAEAVPKSFTNIFPSGLQATHSRHWPYMGLDLIHTLGSFRGVIRERISNTLGFVLC